MAKVMLSGHEGNKKRNKLYLTVEGLELVLPLPRFWTFRVMLASLHLKLLTFSCSRCILGIYRVWAATCHAQIQPGQWRWIIIFISTVRSTTTMSNISAWGLCRGRRIPAGTGWLVISLPPSIDAVNCFKQQRFLERILG
nr:PREDICTED: uncharacterized protein LOC108951727 [Musa acuminata subsp. malaccensis]